MPHSIQLTMVKESGQPGCCGLWTLVRSIHHVLFFSDLAAPQIELCCLLVFGFLKLFWNSLTRYQWFLFFLRYKSSKHSVVFYHNSWLHRMSVKWTIIPDKFYKLSPISFTDLSTETCSHWPHKYNVQALNHYSFISASVFSRFTFKFSCVRGDKEIFILCV